MEIGDRIDHLDALTAALDLVDPLLEVVSVDALLVHVHREDLGLVAAERAERARERGRLGDHDVAGREEGRGDVVDRACAAVGHQEVVRGHRQATVARVALGQEGAQALVPGAAAIAQRRVVPGLERAAHGLEQLLPGQRQRVGDAATEGDRVDGGLDARRHPPVRRRARGQVLDCVAGQRVQVVLGPVAIDLVDDGAGDVDGHGECPLSLRPQRLLPVADRSLDS